MSRFPPFPRSSDLIAWWARLTPSRVAVIDRGRDTRRTYAELNAGADRWARALMGLGVGAGDRVAVLAGNRTELIALFFGGLRIGAVLVPLNWRLAARELGSVLADAAPAVIIGEARFRALGEAAERAAGVSVRWVDCDAEAPALLARQGDDPVEALPADPHGATMLLYTSGSTGRPKGAILPHRQLYYNAVATTVGWQIGADDVAMVANPFFHTGGWHVFSTPLWHRGGTIVLFDQFEPTAFLDALAEERCTLAFSVPTQIVMLMQSPAWGRELPSLRFLISGGAPCPQTVAARVREVGLRFREGYGLTECGPNCFATTDEAALRKPGTVGWPITFLEARVVAGTAGTAGEERDAREAEVDEPGELLLRGPQMFAGYFNDPVRTVEAVDADGWLHTGDLASRDAAGAFRIRGRKKDMFISGGENVFPGEVEAALSECAGVSEVVVVGVSDEKWGEVGHAFVVRRQGHDVAASDIIAHARSRLAGYKVPKAVVLLDELPRLGSGKPDRRALSERAAGALAAGGGLAAGEPAVRGPVG